MFGIGGQTGCGRTRRTTVLGEIQRTAGGLLLTMGDLLRAMRTRHPLSLEETLVTLVTGALDESDCVLLDDLHLLLRVTDACGSYPRPEFLDAALGALCSLASERGKKLIFGCEGSFPDPIRQRQIPITIPDFQAQDYGALFEAFLGCEGSRALDQEAIHRFSPELNAHQLRSACTWIRIHDQVSTEAMRHFLRSRGLAGNVDLSEVEPVTFADLKGVDDVVEALETHVVLPLVDAALANELALQPRRGVLLAGPPGTGKTTVGRALAQRLQGKFFLIDGRFAAGSFDFDRRIEAVFEAAIRNGPAVVFLDDTDTLFQKEEGLGLYRYLLSILDGLESRSARRISLIMTAMDVRKLPAALRRSGRIELWLEMRLPDEAARRAILEDLLAPLPPSLGKPDFADLAAATEGFSGADLRRVVGDAKNLLARARSKGQALESPTPCFVQAIEALRRSKKRYEGDGAR